MEDYEVSENSSQVQKQKVDEVQYVGIDRKISCLEWFMIITGPLVMPLFGPFILLFGIKTYLAKKRQQRTKAMRHKAMLVGLGLWAYRVSCWFCSVAILIFILIKLKRFG